ncbi:hypothetical protein FQZ97_962320 [compost metagenome]
MIEETPEAFRRTQRCLLLLQGTRRGARVHTGIGQQNRQQDQVGEDQDRDTDTGGDCQLPNGLDVHQHQHGKADGVADQRGEAGHEQTAEGVARSIDAIHATTDILHDPIHLLRPMAHADGEDQERNKNRVRIQTETNQWKQTQLPDHGNQGAGHHQGGTAQAAGEPLHHHGSDNHRNGEEEQDLAKPIDQVTHDLGKAHNVNADAILLILGANRFQPLRQQTVVQCLLRLGIVIEQRHDNRA